jgi:hypothetical protein
MYYSLRPAARAIGARTIGCSMSQNLVDRVLIIAISRRFAAIQLLLHPCNVADVA